MQSSGFAFAAVFLSVGQLLEGRWVLNVHTSLTRPDF